MTTDPVHPSHYRNAEGKQIIDVLRNLPFSIGNALKYVYRNSKKGHAVQDLQKALWYLDDFYHNPVSDTIPSSFDDLIDGSFEKEAFTKIFELYEAVGTDSFNKRYSDAKQFIEERISSLTDSDSHSL